MTLTVNSNIRQVIANISRRARAIAGDHEIAILNNTEYAAAVEVGHTRKIVWNQLSRKQRAAIIMSMKERDGQPRKWGDNKEFKVDRFEGGVTVTVPPAGIMPKSFLPIKVIGKAILEALPKGFTDRDLEQAKAEIGAAAQAILVINTPVDQGVLARGWEVRT